VTFAKPPMPWAGPLDPYRRLILTTTNLVSVSKGKGNG
jgi:hypothetical protein